MRRCSGRSRRGRAALRRLTALPEDEPLPAATATLNATTANFDSVYASAAAGNHIVLANGNYGSKTLGRNFSAGAYAISGSPLVIRAENPVYNTASLVGVPNTAGPTAATIAANTALFTGLSMTGAGHIVSGVYVQKADHTTGNALNYRGDNCRITRSIIQNAQRTVDGSGSDNMIDHCSIWRFTVRAINGAKFKQPIVARCWIHTGKFKATPAGTSLFSGLAWGSGNAEREESCAGIARFNCFGPVFDSAPSDDAWVHNKTCDNLYACNKHKTPSRGFNNRFGVRNRYVGNYMPGSECNFWDDLNWWYGNFGGELRVWGGKSAAYDNTHNNVDALGGFHATKRCRIAGNQATLLRLGTNSPGWLTNTHSILQLPDPRPAGAVKPQRVITGGDFPGTYVADDPDHPDTGVKVRAHSGTIQEEPPTSGGSFTNFDWFVNGDVQAGAAAPTAWRTDLFAQYPWLEAIVPNPTSLTGGPGGSAPWSVAQGLTRGDAANPSTGPYRNSVGGKP